MNIKIPEQLAETIIEALNDKAAQLNKDGAANSDKDLLMTAYDLSLFVKDLEDAQKPRAGYLLLLAQPGGLLRLTTTIVSPDDYLSRAGYKNVNAGVQILKFAEISNTTAARTKLRQIFPDLQEGAGLAWTDKPQQALESAMKSVMRLFPV